MKHICPLDGSTDPLMVYGIKLIQDKFYLEYD